MKPTYDNVFVTETEAKTTTASGIILTQDQTTGMKPAKVVAVGPDCIHTRPGDVVYLNWGDSVGVTDKYGTKGAILSEKNILAHD